jgi:hypothetical protein
MQSDLTRLLDPILKGQYCTCIHCIHRRLFILGGVLLPREWIQEIIHKMTVYSTHGLFLSSTQILFVFYTVNRCLIFTQNTCDLFRTPCKNNKEPHTYLEGQLLARGDEFPSTLDPSLVTTAPPFSLHPFCPFPTSQPTQHCLQRQNQRSRSSLSGTGR